MNNCCKMELRKAMQNQRDVAMTVEMAYVLVEALWSTGHSKDGNCLHCGAYVATDKHNEKCPFVGAWNSEEMQYLRYSLDINHDIQVK